MVKVCFYNEKNGVGKTLFTLLTANAISFKFKKKTIILDCSEDQSLLEQRERELKKYSRKGNYEEFGMYSEIKPFVSIDNTDELSCDFLFYDIKSINNSTVDILISCDYVFVVSDSLTKDQKNNLDFNLDIEILEIFNLLKTNNKTNLKDSYLVVNKYSGQQDTSKNKKVIFPFLIISNNFSNYNSFVMFGTSEYQKQIFNKVYKIITNQGSILTENEEQ